LTDILWPGAEAWFDPDGSFVCAADREASLSLVMRRVIKARARPGEIHGAINDFKGKPVDAGKVLPIEIEAPFNLRLAWWLDETRSRFSPLKLWSGRQSSWDVFCKLRAAGDDVEGFDESVLDLTFPLKSRFGLDPRSAWQTLGTGFSPNTLNRTVATYWAAELLAAVGLVFCTPAVQNGHCCYATWRHPLPAIVARAAACGILPIRGSQQFRFELVSRGSFEGFAIARPAGELP
jgi:CRISPR-associated protein Csb3